MLSHNFLIRKLLRKAIYLRAEKHLKGLLIDIGCGTKQYHNVVAPHVKEHIGIDHFKTLHDKSNIDVFATAYSLPFKNNSFDSAICTEVLEHLEEPSKAIRECWRILKPNSIAIYTTPFIWHVHEEPRDFFRYSPYGLKYLFEANGFEVIEISPLDGFCVTFGQLFVYYIYTFNKGALKIIPLIPITGFLIQHFALLADKIARRTIWTSHYISVVRRLP